MKISLICFSRAGEMTGRLLTKALSAEHQAELYCKSRNTSFTIAESLNTWTGMQFREADAIVFISSCGIAVRAVAPFLDSKEEDPAVVVVDEKGTFAISLLSGHLGGANDLAREIGQITSALPVITTATDVNNLMAPDTFAKRNDCVIDDIKAAGRVAAAILSGETVHIYTDMKMAETPPDYVRVHRLGDLENEEHIPGTCRIVISPYVKHRTDDPDTMWIIPKINYIGIGCRRGTEERKIGEAVRGALKELGIDGRSLKKAGSIDLKADEAGLTALCREAGLELSFFTEDQLMEAKGNFTKSDFVKKVTGVESVCERSAIAASGYKGELIMSKKVFDRVTVAIAKKEGKLRFE